LNGRSFRYYSLSSDYKVNQRVYVEAHDERHRHLSL